MPAPVPFSPLDPSTVRLLPALNSGSWVRAEHAPGAFVTASMVDFDTCRADVHVNTDGVVHFYGASSARALLRMPAN